MANESDHSQGTGHCVSHNGESGGPAVSEGEPLALWLL